MNLSPGAPRRQTCLALSANFGRSLCKSARRKAAGRLDLGDLRQSFATPKPLIPRSRRSVARLTLCARRAPDANHSLARHTLVTLETLSTSGLEVSLRTLQLEVGVSRCDSVGHSVLFLVRQGQSPAGTAGYEWHGLSWPWAASRRCSQAKHARRTRSATQWIMGSSPTEHDEHAIQ